MRVLRRAGLGLAALGLLVSATGVRAAVSTSTARVSSGAAPFNISYILAQDATAMTINIRKASDNTIVRTLTSASGAIASSAILKGSHSAEVQWDGATTGGAPAPAGDYYAEIITTGAPTAAMTELSPPAIFAEPISGVLTTFDGRSEYNPSVNRNATSAFKNLAYTGTRASNASARCGIEVTNADGSPNNHLKPILATTANDFLSAFVLPDDNIVSTGATNFNVYVTTPDGTLLHTFGAGRVRTRMMQAFGTADHPELFFIGNSTADTINNTDINYIADVSTYTATSTPLKLVLSSTLPTTSPRCLVVNKAKTAFWVSAAFGSAGTTAWVRKFNITKDGSGNITGATLDPTFNFVFPADISYATGGNNRGLNLSPDESVLWLGMNEGSGTTVIYPTIQNSVILGYNPATGALLDSSKKFVAAYNVEGLGVSENGNIFVTTYDNGTGGAGVTGTTARLMSVVAPSDNGSTDTTRSTKFSLVADTTLRFTTQPTVSNLTYHGCTITWDTNYACDSTVNWGSAAGVYDIGTVTKDSDPDPVTHHVVSLDGLERATLFHYQVTGQETGFTPTPLTSADLTFTTHDLTISAVAPNPLGDVTTTITWTTNEPATSIVHYGLNLGSEDQSVTDNALVTAHSVVITGLKPLTQYYYTVESGYNSGPPPAHVVSQEQSFTTLGSISILTETMSADQTTATLGFTTNIACAATVHYGTARAALTSSISVASGISHSAAFTGLTAGTTYFYNIDLSGAGLAGYTTPVSAFTTGVAGGASTTVTHSAAADFGTAFTTNVDVGASGSLLKLQKQGLPGTPVETTPLPQERYYHACAVSNGYLYVMGGRFNADANNTADTVYYAKINADGTVGAWATTATLPPPSATTIGRMACEGMAFGYNGYIYIIDGADSAFGTWNTVIYAKQNADGTLNPWQTSANLVPEYRDLGAANVIDGHVLLSGGEDNSNSPSNSTAQYMAPIQANGDIGPWYKVTDIPSTRWFNKTVANAHKVYEYGGYNALVWANQAQIAGLQPDGVLGTFDLSPNNMTLLRYNFTAALVGGKLLSVAGRISPNAPDAGIDYAKLMADGTTGTWNTSGSPALHAVDAPDGAVWGNNIYQVGGRTVFSGGAAAAAVPSVQLIPMVPDTADPDGATYAYAGTVESSVIDLTTPTNLKHLKVTATGSVEVRYRFANADGIFSDWFTPSSMDADISGGARYFQYQLVLTGSGTDTPTVSSVALTTVAGVSPLLPGDVNKDGVVDSKDVKLALQIAAGLLNANDPTVSFANGNIVADTVINVLDAVAIQRKINGK